MTWLIKDDGEYQLECVRWNGINELSAVHLPSGMSKTVIFKSRKDAVAQYNSITPTAAWQTFERWKIPTIPMYKPKVKL